MADISVQVHISNSLHGQLYTTVRIINIITGAILIWYSSEEYGQVCAQLFPHAPAFDGMPARAPGRHPRLNSPFGVPLQ